MVTTSDYSIGAKAEITGEAPNQTLNLTIPRGLKGDSGVQLGDVVLTQEIGDNEDAVMSQKSVTDFAKDFIKWAIVSNQSESSIKINTDNGKLNISPGSYYVIYGNQANEFFRESILVEEIIETEFNGSVFGLACLLEFISNN